MKPKRRAEGLKPKVAFRTEERAIENIRLKLSLISRTGKRDSHDLPLTRIDDLASALAIRAHLPRTIRQFNMWKSSSLPAELAEVTPAFTANSAKTLKKSGLELDASEAMKAITEADQLADAKNKEKDASRARLQRELALSNRLRGICERELFALKIERDQLKSALTASANRLKSLEDELARQATKLSSNRTSGGDATIVSLRPIPNDQPGK
jgi:hypothetical protein